MILIRKTINTPYFKAIYNLTHKIKNDIVIPIKNLSKNYILK